MKVIFKVILVLLLLVCAACILLFCARSGYLDSQLEKALIFYLESKGAKVKLQGFSVKGDEIKLDSAQRSINDHTKAEINNLNIKFSTFNLLKSRQLIANISETQISIKNDSGSVVAQATLNGSYHMNFKEGTVNGEIKFDNLEYHNLPTTNLKPDLGSGYCSYKKGFFKEKNINCEIHLTDTSNVAIDAKIKGDRLKLKGALNNVPIAIYKIFEKITSGNKLLTFLDDYIHAGFIKNGEIKVNLDENYYKTNNLTAENLSGKFLVSELEYKYEKDFPALKNIEIDVSIHGPKTQILLSKAYSGSTLISDGVIDVDLAGQVVTATGAAFGPSVDLTDFVPLDSLEKLKKIDIDLRKITGTATTKIELKIPLARDIPNSYNITSDISGVGLNIFNDSLELKNTKISGGFDGARVFLNGLGKINDFESDLSYCFNLKDNTDYDHLLKIKTKIKAQNQKIGLIKVLAGLGLFDFEYKIKGEQSTLNAKADLQKAEIYIDKIAIHKLKNEKANLVMQGDFKDYPNINLNFKLTGDNKLKIIGDLNAKDGQYKLKLPFIEHKDTSVNGVISFDKENFDADIKGSNLDLSNANMMQFLEKDKESTNSELKVKVEKIRLKNNIYLDNLFLTIKCNKSRCYKGYLDSKIGSKYFKMLLKTFAGSEEWVITSTNAGALFKGFGLYDNMKAGVMLVILNTKRQEVKTGEIVPILDGTFTFRNFVVVDTPFLTRLVSFVSLPGLTNLITNNKDVIFRTMNGKFAYDKNIIDITESAAEGPFFDFTLQGKINTLEHKIDIGGNVIPSMYGLSTLLKSIPVLGKIFSGGHRKGLIFAPYSVHQSY